MLGATRNLSAKVLLLVGLLSIVPVAALSQVWTVIAIDAKGNGRDPSAADAAQLSYHYDKEQDMLWLRVGLYSKPNEDSFALNIAVNTGADEAATMNWWGTNKSFR